MEVLLRESVIKLGNRGDIVKVAPGYARNYLLPKRIAVNVTPGNKKQLEIEHRNYERKVLESKSVAEEAKAKLEELELIIPKRAADNGQLYGSVTRMEIAAILNDKGFEVDRRKLEMDHIKELGEYTAKIRLQLEVSAELHIKVERIEEA